MFCILPFRALLNASTLPLVIALSLVLMSVSTVRAGDPDQKSPAVGPDPKSLEEEHSKEAESIVKLANLANEQTLRSLKISEESIQKILDYRAEGKTFTEIIEVQEVSGIKWSQLSEIMKKYRVVDKKPVPVTANRDPRKSLGARDAAGAGEPAEKEPAAQDGGEPVIPFTNVRAGYFGQLPGYEHIHNGDPLVKKEFLAVVNRELCQCGCQNETLAFCLVNDPGCPIVKARVKKVYDDILEKASEAEAASTPE